jgi:adenylate cyclase
VNLASRLEGVNKQFGTEILLSGETYAHVQNQVIAREVDRIRVKGKSQPTRVFELMGLAAERTNELEKFLKFYEQGMEAYYHQHFETALMLFSQALDIRPQDKPTETLINRCQQFLLAHPPVDWDGVMTLESK